VLPNLLIIGAQKCGTSSLHEYLRLHPEVFMSSQKELNFFAGPGWNWGQGREWYEAQFRGGETASVRGESSPSYSMHPWVPGVPERIHGVVPDAKLVYLVRDPIERMISQYAHYSSRGYTRQPISELFSLDRFEESDYVLFSRYAMQLDEYLRHFPPSRILVLAQEDLHRDRAETLRKVFRFLEVDDSFNTEGFAAEYNVQQQEVLHRTLNRLARGRINGERYAALARWVPGLRWLDRRLKRPLARPEIDAELRERLAEYVKPDADRLRELTGMRLESWSV
jgi:hypothetical protein